jgi:hypothetical protein
MAGAGAGAAEAPVAYVSVPVAYLTAKCDEMVMSMGQVARNND